MYVAGFVLIVSLLSLLDVIFSGCSVSQCDSGSRDVLYLSTAGIAISAIAGVLLRETHETESWLN